MHRENEASDHFFLYQLDWENNESVLMEASGALREGGLCYEREPMNAVVRMIRVLAQQCKEESAKFHLDVDYNGTSLAIRICPMNKCSCSAVTVNRSHVAQLLGGSLSPRELEVAMELFEGRTIRYIAQRLQIAEGTVKRTMHNIYCKLGIASQVELVREIYARAARESEN